MRHPELRGYAVAYTPPAPLDGVTFYVLPFSNAEWGIIESQLNGVEPHYRYTHLTTGTVTTVRPADYIAFLRKAREHGMNAEEVALNPWRVEDLWTVTHDNFVNLEARTVDMVFADDDRLSGELRTLRDYWLDAPPDVPGRWNWYRMLLTVDAINAWVDAYLAAEQSRAALAAPARPNELGVEAKEGDDPLPPDAGRSTSTSSSVRQSSRRAQSSSRSTASA